MEGVTEEAVYNTGAVEIKCQYNGTIYPDFFNETYNWCRRMLMNSEFLVVGQGNSTKKCRFRELIPKNVIPLPRCSFRSL